MSRRIPPLLAVRAFEAAARQASFSRAAEELFVTPGAVGHQIKLLEASLGVKLFERGPRSVALTDVGRRYFGEVQAVLERLETCTEDVRRLARSNEVTLTAMPSFVTRWLMPRLGGFQAAHPDIEVRLLASVPAVDFARERVDLAIRLGSGNYPNLHVRRILSEYYLPVAAPPVVKRLGAVGDPRRLLGAGLLHDEYEVRIPDQMDWPRWARRVGAEGATDGRWSRGMHFSHSYLTLEAAASGQGVAMASSVLAGRSLLDGALMPLATDWVRGPYAYHLLHPQSWPLPERAQKLADWLMSEAQAFTAQMQARLGLPRDADMPAPG